MFLSNTSAAAGSGVLPPATAQDLSARNTLGLQSRAAAFVTLSDTSQLPALSDLAAEFSSVLVLGGGSNLVLPEQVPGLVVQVALPGLRLVEASADAWIVEAGGGESWHGVVEACVAQGWDGLENLALIPGRAGAAPVQNIGAYGVELADRFHSLSVWHIRERRQVRMTAADCRFAYRDSCFKHDAPGSWIITAVRFALPRPWRPMLAYPDLQRHFGAGRAQPEARDVFEAVCSIRKAKLPDPARIGNAGSFFKNPLVSAQRHADLQARFPGLVSYAQPDGRYKLAAGWLIDQCGWKGRDHGAAGVHDRQALVLVNRGGARASDIMALARAIQNDVQRRYGVALEPEPIVVAGAA